MTKLGSEATATFQILLAGILWGLVGPLVKLMEYAGATAPVMSFVRMGMAFVIMAAITLFRFGPGAFRISRRSLVACIALGVVSNGLYNVAYGLAIKHAGITVSAVLLNGAPVFTVLASVLVLHEGLTVRKVAALGINVLGCSLAATHGRLDLSTLSVLGVLCGIASAFTYGIAAIITRLSGPATNTYVMSAYSYLFATLTVGVLFQPWDDASLMDPEVLGYGFVLALVPTSLAYLVYYKGILKMRETSKVPIFASVEMVATALISACFFGEAFDAATVAGIALVMASIALMSARGRTAK
ncbi:MAG: DMT family transporter [Coriobacteriia bacterium]|nr:DMT family transporter [Coriobacteriia bacterium]